MVTRGRISLLALALAALLAGCGGDDGEIPEEDANVLLERLNEVEGAVAEGRCEGAQESADLLVAQVSDSEESLVPRRVDEDVREALQAAALRLSELVAEQCTEPLDTEEPPEEPAEPPEPPATEPEETTEEPPPEDEGDDDGSGQGGTPPGQGGDNPGQGGGSGGTAPPSSGGTESG